MTKGPGPFETFSLPHAEAFDMLAASGETYRISVGFPASYASTSTNYPVIYVLDADFFFGTMLEVVRFRGLLGEISEAVVVGIGYPLGTDFRTTNLRRTYDFSTSEWDLTTPVGRDVKGVYDAMGAEPHFGGAPAFLDFLTEDVQPLIADRYRVDTADAALFGVSAAGNFVGHSLFRRPEAFVKYVAASPGFCYNDWDVFALEEEYANTHDDLDAVVYLAAGSGETFQLASGGLVSGTVRMAETLHQRRYPSLQLSCDILADKTHIPAAVEALNRGLDLFWPGTAFEMSEERMSRIENSRKGSTAT
ncbi:alpha/beta hydrolase [Marmoricola sp. RAF53]|uniref:alpha/beta hydrolase n=1 Tax=Marmoricola sp. RAF53 TaxID=3233059 RepID=UPI003F9CA4E3